jgi:hypothetical protein
VDEARIDDTNYSHGSNLLMTQAENIDDVKFVTHEITLRASP